MDFTAIKAMNGRLLFFLREFYCYCRTRQGLGPTAALLSEVQVPAVLAGHQQDHGPRKGAQRSSSFIHYLGITFMQTQTRLPSPQIPPRSNWTPIMAIKFLF